MFFRLQLSLPLFSEHHRPFSHSQINLLRCVIVVEKSNREVTNKVGNEERPILLRHRRLSEINIIDDVNPHVARVVSQVFAKFNCRIRK